MPTLYVIEPDARVEKEYGRILVTRDDEVLLRVAVQSVTAVVLVGRAGVTTPALHALLQRKIPLLLVSRSGELLGSLSPPTARNLPLRQAQYRRNDETPFGLSLAQQIIAAKIHNQRTLARRLARRHEQEARPRLDEMEVMRQAAGNCQSLDSLMGLEGNAARLYFEIYRQCFDPSWQFTKRNRRPPRDPINALLSLGYTFLGYAMMAALEVVGLDPYLGFFHQEVYGRPALALDLIEEFRTPIVDSLVLGLANKHLLEPRDFQAGPGGQPTLSQAGMRVFVREFSEKLESKVTWRQIGRALSYRKLLEVQARRVANLVLGKEDLYLPFQAR